MYSEKVTKFWQSLPVYLFFYLFTDKIHRWLRGNNISLGSVTSWRLWSLGDLRQRLLCLRRHTELYHVGWAKIKTNWTQTDYPLITCLSYRKKKIGRFCHIFVAFSEYTNCTVQDQSELQSDSSRQRGWSDFICHLQFVISIIDSN